MEGSIIFDKGSDICGAAAVAPNSGGRCYGEHRPPFLFFGRGNPVLLRNGKVYELS